MQQLNNPIILFDIDYTLFDTALFKQSNLTQYSLYPEVPDILSNLSNQATLGILSEGEKETQQNKLIKTKIYHFFNKDHIHITSAKQELIQTISEKYKDKSLIIIDDKLTILPLAKKYIPHAFTIWIKRGEYAKNQKPLPGFTPDATLESLTSLLELT
jgi:phosphoglycolate phosphatase-like HAD superfamily hydrolase